MVGEGRKGSCNNFNPGLSSEFTDSLLSIFLSFFKMQITQIPDTYIPTSISKEKNLVYLTILFRASQFYIVKKRPLYC